MISIDDFKKVELRVGKVISVEPIDGSEKLLKLKVDIGAEERRIVAGIGQHYSPENLVGRLIVICVNLEPRNIMGLESQGMLLAASNGETVAILAPDAEKQILPGALIR